MPRQEIRITGYGGQGVILTGYIFGKAAAIYDNRHSTMTQSFGPEARGSACAAALILDDNVTDDGGSRIYLNDGDVMKVALAQPISVVDSDHPIYVGHYHKANIYGVGELTVTRFKGSGQIMDLTP